MPIRRWIDKQRISGNWMGLWRCRRAIVEVIVIKRHRSGIRPSGISRQSRVANAVNDVVHDGRVGWSGTWIVSILTSLREKELTPKHHVVKEGTILSALHAKD